MNYDYRVRYLSLEHHGFHTDFIMNTLHFFWLQGEEDLKSYDLIYTKHNLIGLIIIPTLK